MTNKVLVFDLDDTLIDNVHDYADSLLDSAKLVIRTLGSKAPHVAVIIALQQDIDKRRRGETNPATGTPFGYAMERFPGTLVEVYRTICQKAGVEAETAVEEQMYAIGMQAFDVQRHKRNIKPDALETVSALSGRGFVPMLLSAGDKRVQANKLSAINASVFFWGGIHIVDKKTPDVFRNLRRRYEGHNFWSIGNNYDSDIVPALEAGYGGVWIPVETWETLGQMDEIRAKVDKERCLEMANISELWERCGEL